MNSIQKASFQHTQTANGIYQHGPHQRVLPPTSKGHHYVLIVMDMLSGFISCASLKSKKAKEIVQVYLNEVYYRFGGSRKILSDNGTKLKNKMFQEV